jgi:hypothetical protein
MSTMPINIFFFSAETGRTFGHHFLKRISFAIIPAAFVVGVITTLLAALTVVSIKSLGTGVRYNCFIFVHSFLIHSFHSTACSIDTGYWSNDCKNITTCTCGRTSRLLSSITFGVQPQRLVDPGRKKFKFKIIF